MRKALVVTICVFLAGCNTVAKHVPAQLTLPPLPADLREPCYDPGVDAGKPIVGEFAENRLARADCARRYDRVVHLYEDGREAQIEASRGAD